MKEIRIYRVQLGSVFTLYINKFAKCHTFSVISIACVTEHEVLVGIGEYVKCKKAIHSLILAARCKEYRLNTVQSQLWVVGQGRPRRAHGPFNRDCAQLALLPPPHPSALT